MRSSKNRSRNKGNRNRSVGNVINRVFDSSGPEGKVRGTPQQIIDKYTQLARDAQLGNDRVAAENFQQHAEHYTRILGEAMREQEARREAQEAQNRNRQRDRDQSQQQHQPQQQPADPGAQPQPVVDLGDMPQPDAGGPDIVDVPESGNTSPGDAPKAEGDGQKPARRQRRPRKSDGDEAKPAKAESGSDEPQEAAE